MKLAIAGNKASIKSATTLPGNEEKSPVNQYFLCGWLCQTELERDEKDGFGYWWICPRCGWREWIRED